MLAEKNYPAAVNLITAGPQKLTPIDSALISRGFSLVREIETDSETIFSDPGLEKAVRDALRKTTGILSIKELSGLKMLNASRRGIKTLKGISRLISLEDLHCMGNRIDGTEDLSKLENLRCLNLSNNFVAGISDIAQLKNL